MLQNMAFEETLLPDTEVNSFYILFFLPSTDISFLNRITHDTKWFNHNN